MASFLNIIMRNVLEGPSTTPFPFGETFSPDSIRGVCVVDQDRCMGCGTCNYVCVADAIKVIKEDNGWRVAIWQNRCCLCGSCVTYCPVHAISFEPNWHLAHPQEDKYKMLEQKEMALQPCAKCGKEHRVLNAEKAALLYKDNPEINPEEVRHLCRDCRQHLAAEKQAERVNKLLEAQGMLHSIEGGK